MGVRDWLMGRVASALPPLVKQGVKGKIRAASIRWDQWRYNLTARDLVDFLSRLGVRSGDVLFVHSSFDAFRGFLDLTPLGVIKSLQEVVGDSGTLAMPTLPFTGSAIDYITEGPTFDVRRTPSKMGLLTELFRRMPGVARSVHPTHPVAVWGPRADELVRDHHTAQTPCGRPSPYEKLIDCNGRILMLGTGIMSMTFFHTIDELLETDLPFEPFTKEVYTLRSRTIGGELVETRTRLYRPDAPEARQRFEEALPDLMKERGTWREGRLGRLDVILIDARDVVDALRAAAA